MKIKDCKAIVTGGASGLGKACIAKLVKGGSKAAAEAVLMITPFSPSSFGVLFTICATARRATLKVPIKLIWIIRLKVARGMGPFFDSILPGSPMPAQLITTLMPPNESMAF